MFEHRTTADWLNWRFLGLAVVANIITLFLDALLESDGLLFFFVVSPIVTLILLMVSVIAAISKKPRRSLAVLSMLAVFLVLSFSFFKHHLVLRSAVRWFLWSGAYKAEVLRQPEPGSGELKHIDWDRWGFAGVGDTTVYLVFDPRDSLAVAAKDRLKGKFSGIPCAVPFVDRLESQWYAVMFYTDEHWDKSNSDCNMKD